MCRLPLRLPVREGSNVHSRDSDGPCRHVTESSNEGKPASIMGSESEVFCLDQIARIDL